VKQAQTTKSNITWVEDTIDAVRTNADDDDGGATDNDDAPIDAGKGQANKRLASHQSSNVDDDPVRDGRRDRTRNPAGGDQRDQAGGSENADNNQPHNPDEHRNPNDLEPTGKRKQGVVPDPVDGEPLKKSQRHSNAVDEHEEQLPHGQDSEEDIQARHAFVTRWTEFLGVRTGENQARWVELYERANRVFQAWGEPEYPLDDVADDEAHKEFRIRINQALKTVIGRMWQPRIDKVSVNEDKSGAHQGAEWKRTLQLAREAAMRRAREGEADV
jgi:hypothetical protein